MAAKIGSSAIDRSLHPYSMCMWTNSDHPSGGRIKAICDHGIIIRIHSIHVFTPVEVCELLTLT